MSTRSLSDATPALAAKIEAVKAQYLAMFPNRNIREIEVLRTDAEQAADFAAGRSKLDGVTKKSKHQPGPDGKSRAVDLGVFNKANTHYLTNVLYYEPLVGLAAKNGLRSGLDWDRDGISDIAEHPRWLHDGPHLEEI